MVAPAFGFSVGDFIAAFELIQKSAKSLHKSTGAIAQFQQTLADLRILEAVLVRVQRLTPETASAETLHTVSLCSLQCQIPLDRFRNVLEKFRSHLIGILAQALLGPTSYELGAKSIGQWL